MADPEITAARVEQLYIGRGLRGEPVEDDVTEVSVNLADLGDELSEALVAYQARRWRVWLPLTTVSGGVPELVWDADDSLIPTQVPVPVDAEVSGFGGIGTPTEGSLT